LFLGLFFLVPSSRKWGQVCSHGYPGSPRYSFCRAYIACSGRTPIYHLYAILADDTPPVGVAAYAAAVIAGADPIKTGFLGFKFDLAAFLLPFMFVYNPSLLLIDTTWYKAILIAATSLFGMYCFAAVIQRWLFTRLKIWEQVVLLAIAVSMVWPNVVSDIIGLAVFCLIYFSQRARKAREDQLNISYIKA